MTTPEHPASQPPPSSQRRDVDARLHRPALLQGDELQRELGQRRERFQALPGFWRAIYDEGTGFVALFSGERLVPEARLTRTHEAYFAWPQETAGALTWIAGEAGEERELYQCAHLVTRWRRRREDAATITTLWVDLDVELPKAPVIAPSLTVESSPAHYQLYFQLIHPLAGRAAEELNRRLALALGADQSGWDLSQLLRIPGGRNHKYAERPEVRLLEQTGHRYDPEDLVYLLPRVAPRLPRPAIERTSPIPQPSGGEPPLPLSRAARAIWEGQDVKLTPHGDVDRSASLVRIARILVRAGLAGEQIATLLAERDATLGWRKYADRDDAGARQYRRLVAFVQQGSPTTGRGGRR